jgi:hypothetical protein
LDDHLVPYSDQWAYLASVKKVDEEKLDSLIRAAAQRRELLPVAWQSESFFEDDETGDEDRPWKKQVDNLFVLTGGMGRKQYRTIMENINGV